MAKDIEIKSSLLNRDDFAKVKASLIAISQIDNEDKFRVKTLEYINDSSATEDDEFFFDMLEYVRFLMPDDDAVAYTTPDGRIFLNCPKKVIDGIRQWDFVYDHECLHQLWDTFGVEKKIKDQYKECDHDLLNIASDCVINDYLYYYRKKARPNDLVTPELLKEKYGVEYNRKNDTQFTLYLKLKKVKDTQQELFKKMMEDPAIKKALEDFGDRKIKPKSVQQGQPTPPPQPSGPHSDDFKKGWIDAIKDVLDKKVDPLTYKPKQEKSDYEKGYNKAMDNIKQGLENGITMSKSMGKQNGPNSDLPQIPWETPSQGGSGSGSGSSSDDNNSSQPDSNKDIDNMSGDDAAKSAQKSADTAKSAAKKAADKAAKSGNKKDLDAAKKAADAADKAQKAAEDSKDAADSGDDDGAKEAAKEAADAAREAQSHSGSDSENPENGSGSNRDSDLDDMTGGEAAQDAEQSADNAKAAASKLKDLAEGKGSDSDNKAGLDKDEIGKLAEEAKKAADKAEKAAAAAKKAAANGDTKTAKEKAKEARNAAEEAESKLDRLNREKGDGSESSSKSSSNNSSQNGTPGTEAADINIETAEDIEKLKKNHDELIKRYANKISGDFGEFIKKCKKSLELNESGLGIGNRKSAPGWNQQMNAYVTTYVKSRVFQKKRQFKKSYTRVKRGSGFVKAGQPIMPGKHVRDDKLTINVAFYIDRSGSMDSGNAIDHVFKAAYTISESLKKQFARENVVDEITFKMYAFDYKMHELKWGDKINAYGGTMNFETILEYIKNHTSEYLINVIITDAQFNITEGEVDRFIKDIKGMLLFITNSDNGTMKQLSKKYDTQLYYVLADSAFTIKN